MGQLRQHAAPLDPQEGRGYAHRMAMTDEQKRKMLALIRKGIIRPTAASMVGVLPRDVVNACVDDPGFARELRQTCAAAQGRLELTEYEAALTDPNVASRVLAKRDPLNHSERVQAHAAAAVLSNDAACDALFSEDMIAAARALIHAQREALALPDGAVIDAEALMKRQD